MKAVRFNEYGDSSVLEIVDVERPALGDHDVAVAVRAAGINPGEAKIRSGALHDQFPATFPSGEGSDLAGVVLEVGAAVTEWNAGDEVFGWTDARASHAEEVVVPAGQLVRKPPALSWEVAGSLFVAGSTAWAASHAIDPQPGETVLVSAAAGGVGTLTVQLLATTKVHVLAVASDRHRDWLARHGVEQIAYGPDLAQRVRRAAPNGVDAVIDLHGPEYVRLAVDLGVSPHRVNSVIAFAEAARIGAKTEGNAEGASTEVLRELAGRIVDGRLEAPISGRYPLDQVRAAYDELEKGHTFGKLVLLP
ncbi:NADP-dependent oxidoreductase [Flexivirga meconopsidis]|uniref:NADP-dependent oxidoreductase n=1 Tax=Flexivirga meconopsidis TaxID=2977121 RepID=UPI00223EADB9|nr:NADP-dependent oxidoreductase [Flexivirga meconopsidis]